LSSIGKTSTDSAKSGRGIEIENDIMYVRSVEDLLKVAEALSSRTRIEILGLIASQEMGIEDIARILGQSKANISTHVKRLEEANLVKPEYRPGQRGVKKIARLTVRRIIIELDTIAQEASRKLHSSLSEIAPKELESKEPSRDEHFG